MTPDLLTCLAMVTDAAGESSLLWCPSVKGRRRRSEQTGEVNKKVEGQTWRWVDADGGRS